MLIFIPFVEARLSFFGRVGRFSCKSRTEDIKGDKASVQSEGADGIPIFLNKNVWKAAVKHSDRKHSGT
ncbi:MAG: hypothetical protein K2H63_01015 [Paramuribaculum sp.]|nr:hypothetical protein [Paramuribaculum sp.]